MRPRVAATNVWTEYRARRSSADTMIQPTKKPKTTPQKGAAGALEMKGAK